MMNDWAVIRKVKPKRNDCGCRIMTDGSVFRSIAYCPKHAAVDQLLEAAVAFHYYSDDDGRLWEALGAAIKQAKGETEVRNT